MGDIPTNNIFISLSLKFGTLVHMWEKPLLQFVEHDTLTNTQKHTQNFRYIMDRSHNCAHLLLGLPSPSLFVLSDFPVCLINKRQDRAGQG